MRTIASRPAPDASVIAQAEAASRAKNNRQREVVFRQARVVLESGERLDVVVKDVSPTGARIEFFKRVQLSTMLRIKEQSLKLNTLARVIWQREGAAGIAFVIKPPDS